MARVAGTRVTLVPPAGFVPATQFRGFENEALEAAIGVTELPTGVDGVRQGLVGSEVVVDGRPALLVEAQEVVFGSAITKSMVVIGDRRQSVLIVATSPSEAGLGPALREVLLSARWTSDEPPPVDDLPFRFAECPPLRIATRMGNVVLLTEHGAVGLDAAAAMLTIGGVPADRDRDLAEIASDHLASLPGLEDVAPVSAEDLALGSGVPAFELVADAVSAGDGLPIRVVQLVVRIGDQDVVAVGRSSLDRFDALVGAFRSVGRSLAP